jgi:hypothetical protein
VSTTRGGGLKCTREIVPELLLVILSSRIGLHMRYGLCRKQFIPPSYKMVVLSNPSDAYFGCSVMRLSMVAALVLLWGLNSFATKDPYLRTTVPPPWRNLTFFYDSRNPGHAGQHQADRSRFRSRRNGAETGRP